VTRAQGLLLIGLAIAGAAVWIVLLGQLLAPDPVSRPTSIADAGSSPMPPATARPTATPAPIASASAPPTAAPSPTPEPATPTDPPAVGGGGRPAFLAFLARMDAARAEAEDLNADLRDAGEASDEAAVRSTAADMDDLVDRERGWLDANPPDPCFADAHAAADDLLAAYGSVAAAANGWADASGLDVLSALAQLYDAVELAAAEAADLGQGLEACRVRRERSAVTDAPHHDAPDRGRPRRGPRAARRSRRRRGAAGDPRPRAGPGAGRRRGHDADARL
jgi:hypothetical protein